MICGHCKAENTTIAHVRECSTKGKSTSPMKPEVAAKFPAKGVEEQPWSKPEGTKVNLSIVKDGSAVAETLEFPDGIYTWNSPSAPDYEPIGVYKVQTSPNSGRQYAKKLIVDPETKKGFFEYAPGIIYKLKEAKAEKLTLELAKEFGALYGACCVCGRVLTNEESIEAGIGPICAGKLA